jgi:DNA-binding response OmpR family regulator
MQILLIEDEVQLARQVVSSLEQAGHELRTANRGETALSMLQDSYFDLLVVDIRLPGINGFEVLRQVRENRITSRVLMLTADAELRDKVMALQLGADDYLTKPFAMQELLARVEALGRRYPDQPKLALQVSDLILDLATTQLRRAGRKIELSVREFALLRVLMREPGRVFTRTELCERIWQRQHEYDAKLVEVFIGRLRKKINAPHEIPLIKTVRHVGYTIISPP